MKILHTKRVWELGEDDFDQLSRNGVDLAHEAGPMLDLFDRLHQTKSNL
jgi:hypothetical protein